MFSMFSFSAGSTEPPALSCLMLYLIQSGVRQLFSKTRWIQSRSVKRHYHLRKAADGGEEVRNQSRSFNSE